MKKKDQDAALQQEGRGPQHMPIGEFGGAPAPPGQAGPILAAPMYWFYEMSHAALNPSRAFADAAKIYFKSPINPLSYTTFGKSVAAACELFERSTRRYGQPEWGIDAAVVGGERIPVHINAVWQRPFCRLLHFERIFERPPRRPQPRVLLVAPMSGHYPTLLRGTVEAFLPNHDVYITEWVDARMVPLTEGPFDLDDYIDYIISILHVLRGDVHVIGVCQPSVPVLAAIARMEADADPYVPHSMVLMGGPIDTRANPTAVNRLAQQRGIDWFRRNVITKVPFPHPGLMRDVYPGFLQLNGFMSMNLDRHIEAHKDLFMHLVRGDGDSAQKHREFYDEYLAVMDLAAEFYLQTVDSVFVRHALPKGEFTHRGVRVDPARRADDGRGRERRYFRRRPDRGRASPVRQSPGRSQGALSPARRRPLRRVQRVALPRRDRAADRRFRAYARRHRRAPDVAQGRRPGLAAGPRRARPRDRAPPLIRGVRSPARHDWRKK
jgi:poly(3-hydroxybutyrate) depolymerase